MPREVIIGLWTFDAGDLFGDGKRSWTKSIPERIAGLRSIAEKIQSEVSGNAELQGFNSILAAPEYLFSNRVQEDGLRLPLTELERLELEVKLLELSRSFPRMVMIPGTLFYAKDLVRPPEADKKFNPETGVRDLTKSSSVSRREKYLRKIDAAIGAADQLFSNEHEREDVKTRGFVVGRNDYAVPPLANVKKTLQNEGAHPRIVRNAAYILLNGKRVAKYDKCADYGETRGASADDLAFVPGTTHQCPEIDGCRFGVEICYDHQVGALARRGVPDLRFHVLVSDATENIMGNMAMAKEGYFLHASTGGSETKLFFRKQNGLVEGVKKISKSYIFGSDDVKLYRVTLPD